MRPFLLALTLIGLATTAASAADWPQFLGPASNSVSPETGLLKSFPAGGPKVLWTVAVGPGYGGPAVEGGKVYLLDRVNDQKDALRCLNLADGKEEWRFEYDAPGTVGNNGSRSTPTVTDKFIFTVGLFGHLTCIDKTTHKPVWQKNILSDFGGGKLPKWAVSQSPIFYKGLLIVAPLNGTVGLVALDPATGAVKWQSKPVGGMQYASPEIVKVGGADAIAIMAGGGAAMVNPASGNVLCQLPYKCSIPIPNVTQVDDTRFFVTGGYKAGSALFQVAAGGVKELWRDAQIGAHIQQPIVYKGCIYAVCNTNDRTDGLVCWDLAGKVLWQTGKSPSLDKGNLILTGDGTIYSMDGASGDLRIIQPDPAGYKELAKTPLLGGKEIWGAMAIANGKLLARDQKQLKCVDIKAP